jgi:ferredoxin-NADP reductase
MSEPAQDAEVVRVRQLSPLVRELTLAPLQQPVHFQPGQWISLRLPIGTRPPLVRAYSMAEPEAPDGRLVLAFDRVPGGQGSGFLYSLQERDRVTIAGPFGKFIAPEGTSDVVFVARFTGIVPIRCMIRTLSGKPSAGNMMLIYGCPHKDERIYHDEFEALQKQMPAFHYKAILSENAEPENAEKEIQALADLCGNRRDFTPFVCGVKSFVHTVRAFFMERGFNRKDVKQETYD